MNLASKGSVVMDVESAQMRHWTACCAQCIWQLPSDLVVIQPQLFDHWQVLPEKGWQFVKLVLRQIQHFELGICV